jgi:hypothetical protein
VTLGQLRRKNVHKILGQSGEFCYLLIRIEHSTDGGVRSSTCCGAMVSVWLAVTCQYSSRVQTLVLGFVR